jgi:hypothetical protein
MSQTEVQLIKDGVIVNADLHSSANISASKLLRPIDLADSEKIRFGTGNDFEIFHDGTSNIFQGDGTADFKIQDASHTSAVFDTSAEVQLYHDNALKFETTSAGAKVSSPTFAELQIRATGASDAQLTLVANDDNDTDWSIRNDYSESNDLDIRFNNARKMNLDTNGNLFIAGNFDIEDNDRLLLGASDDFQIYHDTANNYILSPNGHPLTLESDHIQLRAVNNELYFKGLLDGAVSLYNNNALRLQTTTAGADILRSDAAVVFKVESTSNDSSHDSIIRMKVAHASADCHIQFADPDDDDVGQIMYDHSINALKFILNTSEEFRMEADGDFHADGDVIAASTTISSDLKLKENIEVVSNPIEKVEALRGVTFDWKRDGKKSAGVIAQDVEKVLPQAVKETRGLHDAEPYKTVNYHALTSIFIEAIKELSARVKELEAK